MARRPDPDNDRAGFDDEVLGRTYDYLDAVCAAYRRTFNRKPTVDELEALLTIGLQMVGAADGALAGLDSKVVTGVKVRRRQRTKRQTFRVGDVFAIPLENARFAFGRIMNLEDGWELVEVFAHVQDTPRYFPTILNNSRLLHPFIISTKDAFASWSWRVMASNPSYAPDLASLRFAMGAPGHYKRVEPNTYRGRDPLSDEEAARLPKWKFQTFEADVAMVHRALRERKLLA